MNEKKNKMTVIVVEDEERILSSISRKIAAVAEDCEIVATACDGVEALNLIYKLRPNIVFTDIKMPNMDGLELSKEIKLRFPNIYVVILSGYSDFSFAQEAIRYGVFSYLLKPLDEDKLKDVLNDIRVVFEEDNNRINRSFKYSEQSLPEDQPFSQIYDNSKLLLFLLCIDNLCYNNNDEFLEQTYRKMFSIVDWDSIIDRIDIKSSAWLVTEEKAVNQEMLVIALANDDVIDTHEIAQQICNQFKNLYNIQNINICCHAKPINKHDMWFYSKRMRNVIYRSVILTKPAIYLLEENENIPSEQHFDVIKNRIDTIIKNQARHMDYDIFQEQIAALFEYLYQTNITQRHFERMLAHLFYLLENSLKYYDVVVSEYLLTELNRTLCVSSSYNEIMTKLFAYIDNIFNRTTASMKKKDMQAEVLDYVDKNIFTIEKIEDVAGVFHYNTTYLSRMFKNIKGISLIKYITEKRIEYVKTIIETNPEIAVGEIGAMAGFNDPHYFSRIFKSLVGVSPSEYRISCKEHDK